MNKNRNALLVFALCSLAGSALANDPDHGRNMAAACASCHGTNGKSLAGMEALAGYPRDKMIKNMRDFRSGAKPATLMHQLAKGYNDAQIEAIATFYAAQK